MQGTCNSGISESKKKSWDHVFARSSYLPGCDTSRPGIGIAASLLKIQCISELSKIGDVFMKDKAHIKDDIIKARENVLVILYNGEPGEELNALHFRKFQEKVLKSYKYVNEGDVTPTSGAAKFHSLRAYYQVQVWRGKSGPLDPKKCGWEIISDQLICLWHPVPK